MVTIRSLSALAATTVLALGTGCSAKPWKVPEGIPSTAMSPQVMKPEGDSSIVQAGGTSPFATLPSSLSWLTGKTSERASKSKATEIAVTWRNHIDYLPDPARNGAMGPGLAGQVFLLGPDDKPALAEGTLTVELHDETPRPPGQQPGNPERWQFKKDVLKALRDVDERFGPNYVVFLPWPSYRADITRVRIMVRFDPDQGGYTLYAPESKVTLDPTLSGSGTTGGSGRPLATPQPGPVVPAGGTAASTPSPTGTNSGPGMGPIRIGGPRSAFGGSSAPGRSPASSEPVAPGAPASGSIAPTGPSAPAASGPAPIPPLAMMANPARP